MDLQSFLGFLGDRTFVASALTLMVGAVTLWVVKRQLAILLTQQKTLQSQGEVAEKLSELLSRQAKLKVVSRVTPPSERDPNRYLDFSVENMGNKTASDFYWELFIPRQFTQHGFTSVDGEVDAAVERLEGIEYSRFSGHFDTPVYPSRRVKLGRFPAEDPGRKGVIEIQWILVAEDGMFPAEGIRGKTTVPIAPVS